MIKVMNMARIIKQLTSPYKPSEGLLKSGFTLVELIVVMVILGISAMVLVPMIGSAASSQLSSASDILASDLEYARSMAISRGYTYSVVFDVANNTYEIRDETNTVIRHPVKKGFDYVVRLGPGQMFDTVTISSADFNSTNVIKFDSLGSPYSGTNAALNSGAVVLQAANATMTVSVEPVTGYISISE
jgi:prepilin-type N-terminal cleavage/methylation domain-containing protein